jgi:PleD family two-component response regulator
VAVLDRVRAELAVLAAGGTVPTFTVSFGVADHRDGNSLHELIDAADRALLVAKRTGRNRTVLAGSAPDPDLAGAPEPAARP